MLLYDCFQERESFKSIWMIKDAKMLEAPKVKRDKEQPAAWNKTEKAKKLT